MKNINRQQFLDFLMNATNLTYQSQVFKNIYLIGASKKDYDFQIEFIPQSSKYFFTILVRGITKEADFLHEQIVEYVKGLQLGRNISIDTEYKTTLV